MRERYADVLALSTYPSRGLRLFGCELKSRRSDVVKELQDPDKAETIQRYCDRWYLVVGRKDLVSPDELPDTWGLMVPHRGGLKITKEAPTLDARNWPRDFVASLLRNAWRNKPSDKALAEDRKAGLELGLASAKSELEHVKEDLRRLNETVNAFQAAAGIRLDGWLGEERARKDGAAFKAFKEAGIDNKIRFALSTAENLEKAAAQLRQVANREA
jgi:hypothetical protein